ncbi:MAG: hypothetical protein IAG13_27510 [Deltaproteobacteria bacterium]|nr:hypothetical protein [Nannocystaceae bacterium]
MNSTAQPSVHAAWGSPLSELLLPSELLALELLSLELSLAVLVSTAVVSLLDALIPVVVLVSPTVVVDDDAPRVSLAEDELEPGVPVDSTPAAGLDPPQPIAMIIQASTDKRMPG